MFPIARPIYIVGCALLLSLARVPGAEACEKAQKISSAFDSNIDYQASRAERIFGEGGGRHVRRGFDSIETSGIGCRELYDQYKAYLSRVTEGNDRAERARMNLEAERAGKGLFGFTFKKW